jgi:hypothetical protein
MIKGCIVYLFELVDQKPDECVLDTGDYQDCVYADILVRENGGPQKVVISSLKNHCKYWKPETNEVSYEELKEAFMDVCDGNYKCWDDIQCDTGFDKERCQAIWNVYDRLVKGSN